MNYRKSLLSALCALALLGSGIQTRAEDAELPEPDEPKAAEETVLENQSDTAEVQAEQDFSANTSAVPGYEVHLSNVGWTAEIPAGNSTPEGRIEAIRIHDSGIDGKIIYQVHVQNIGWMDEVSSGSMAGTTGRNYQTEAIRIRLSGNAANQFDIWYRTKVAGSGWLGWTKNGSSAGSEGYAAALQSIEIRLLSKTDTSLSEGMAFYKKAGVSIQTHVENKGWMTPVGNGELAGTTGQALRMEALIITLSDELAELGNIEIETHVQNKGWMSPVGSGATAGTTGEALQMEALRIRPTGRLAELYDVFYRVHVRNVSWLGWTKNGGTAGTSGYALAIESIEIAFEPKDFKSYDTSAPSSYEYKKITYKAHSSQIGWQADAASAQTAGTPGKAMEALTITLPAEYTALGNIRTEAHVQNKGWMSAVGSGEIAGTTGEALQMEGIKLSLTGSLSNLCDIYYRVYVKGLGWLGWTRNGGLAGSEGCNRPIEAIQIDVVHKKAKSYPLSTAYTTLKWNDFTDVNSILVCANKKHRLPEGYAPADLVVPNVPMNYSGTTMRAEAARALERMFTGARNVGITLRLGSGYRSEAYQRTLYNGYVAQYGAAVADTISSRPGYSDHQTGLAADISDHDGRTYLTEAMENTVEGRWLRDHAHEYGFIMRYPKGKQAITGYAYEPWHFRYVGVETATAIYNVNVWYTFEEYFGVEGGDYY